MKIYFKTTRTSINIKVFRKTVLLLSKDFNCESTFFQAFNIAPTNIKMVCVRRWNIFKVFILFLSLVLPQITLKSKDISFHIWTCNKILSIYDYFSAQFYHNHAISDTSRQMLVFTQILYTMHKYSTKLLHIIFQISLSFLTLHKAINIHTSMHI